MRPDGPDAGGDSPCRRRGRHQRQGSTTTTTTIGSVTSIGVVTRLVAELESVYSPSSRTDGSAGRNRKTTPFISLGWAVLGMLQNLGALGIVGLLLLIAGIGLIAYQNLLIAAGMALIVAGLGLVVKSLISGMLQNFGMF
ncbi:hypothetical protein J0X25_18800 [Haloterrigena alkaliphila]|nr:hypothetical protein [Haloterrigena alkaliphila]UHQ95045.1 hypothetical protein J0X25_18800 [Haloterrigena alkaliphila]